MCADGIIFLLNSSKSIDSIEILVKKDLVNAVNLLDVNGFQLKQKQTQCIVVFN